MYVTTGAYLTPSYRSLEPVTLVHALVVLTMNTVYRVPRDGSNLLSAGMRSFARMLLGRNTTVDELMPKDIRTIARRFDLDPRTRKYLCCQMCWAMYDMRTMPLPNVCHHRGTEASVACSTPLWRERLISGEMQRFPLRVYLHQELKEWFGRLLCRPGMENYLDRELYDAKCKPGEMRDIWDGQVLKTPIYKLVVMAHGFT